MPSAATSRASSRRKTTSSGNHFFASGLIILLVAVNTFGVALVIRSENAFNLGKMALLVLFIIVGLANADRMGALQPVSLRAAVRDQSLAP